MNSFLDPQLRDQGRWHLEYQLGAGSFGRVFKATDRFTGRLCSFKIFNQKIENDGFFRELGLLLQEEHPHIVQILDFGFGKGKSRYIVYEYLKGGSLRDYLLRHSRAPLSVALDILYQCALALSFAHERGIVHRDLKPENILLTEPEWPFQVKLCDFGHSIRSVSELQDISSFGSPGYMAPEQFGSRYDRRVDFYALGVIFFEMLLGQKPWPGEVLKRCSALPESIRDLLQKLLSSQPEDRYESAALLLQDLDKAAKATAHTSTDTASDAGIPLFWKKSWELQLEPPLWASQSIKDGGLLLAKPDSIVFLDEQGKTKILLQNPPKILHFAAESSLNQAVAWCSSAGVEVLADGGRTLLVSPENPPEKALFSPNFQRLALAFRDHIEVWSMQKKLLLTAKIASYGQAPPMAYSKDSSILWVGVEAPRTQMLALKEDGSVHSRFAANANDVRLQSGKDCGLVVGSLSQPKAQSFSLEGVLLHTARLQGSLLEMQRMDANRLAAVLEGGKMQVLDCSTLQTLASAQDFPKANLFYFDQNGFFLLKRGNKIEIERYELSPGDTPS